MSNVIGENTDSGDKEPFEWTDEIKSEEYDNHVYKLKELMTEESGHDVYNFDEVDIEQQISGFSL
ncbi:MAG TPA: hypothetical protein DEP72_00815 [Clostridiales bacterium]|nr:MAG: hypothetical protein A2Y18_04415 [Clostridiales bacterium GWD2_32_19]HCC06694.1 hypothetical protein [Clostridiales bacterium]